MQGHTMYVNGEYRVIPIVIAYAVRDAEGRTVYRSKSVDEAVDACDHMAELDSGVRIRRNGGSKFSPLPHRG